MPDEAEITPKLVGVCEDDEVLRSAVKRGLEGEGFHVIAVATGGAAIERFAHAPGRDRPRHRPARRRRAGRLPGAASGRPGLAGAVPDDAVNLANNHAHDYGDRGYASTRRTLRRAGVNATGAPGETRFMPQRDATGARRLLDYS
jgi:CheY-like chemotaxis protein